ncbi:peptidoglycan-binding domain-containing protein [Bacillus swezeyi]|uniref:peptidoglycan-binding domain-containing protein n=1 Tax=Bacillus swezeyi TaxID=1925020 RepID=UPI0039C6AE04
MLGNKTVSKTTSSTSQSSKSTGIILKKGSSGSKVKSLQKRLIAAGFSLPKYGADGSYGNETVQAVKALQKRVSRWMEFTDWLQKRLSQVLKRKRKSRPQAAKNHPTRCRLASIR